MKSLNNDKKIKKATMYAGFWKEATDIFFMTSVAMATICVGAGTTKALGTGKNHLPLGSLALTTFVASVSFFFLGAMSNIIKNDALDERNRLIKEQKDNEKLVHHKNHEFLNKAQSNERSS